MACARPLQQPFAGAVPGEGGFIADWISLLDEARSQVVAAHGTGTEAIRPLEEACVEVSLANLRTFPFVAKAEAEGTLTLHGAYFAIADGVLHLRDEVGAFSPVQG